MRRLIFAVVFASVLLLSKVAYAGPFGLEPGMSRAEVVKIIGKSAILEERKDSIDFKTVPVQSIYFDDYLCFFDAGNRLWSIHASSKLLAARPMERIYVTPSMN